MNKIRSLLWLALKLDVSFSNKLPKPCCTFTPFLDSPHDKRRFSFEVHLRKPEFGDDLHSSKQCPPLGNHYMRVKGSRLTCTHRHFPPSVPYENAYPHLFIFHNVALFVAHLIDSAWIIEIGLAMSMSLALGIWMLLKVGTIIVARVLWAMRATAIWWVARSSIDKGIGEVEWGILLSR